MPLVGNVIRHPAYNGSKPTSLQYAYILRHITLQRGTMRDYKHFQLCHYRDTLPGPVAHIWTIQQHKTFSWLSPPTVGIIVYTYPAPNVAARRLAFGPTPEGLSRSQALRRLNRNLRTIARVIIAPQWRGLGLASWLVRTTMPKLEVAWIESLAAMGRYHPFLEKAGMTRYDPPVNKKAVWLGLTLEDVNIPRTLWHDPQAVQARIDSLDCNQAGRLERYTRSFLGAYGCRRTMGPGLERTDFILRKLAQPPAYFAWKNPNVEEKD